ncbi:MAG: hypothetical protein AAF573_00570 [Bacteroidota bacterium]
MDTILQNPTEEKEVIPSTTPQPLLGYLGFSYRLINESSERIFRSKSRLEVSYVKERQLGNSKFF